MTVPGTGCERVDPPVRQRGRAPAARPSRRPDHRVRRLRRQRGGRRPLRVEGRHAVDRPHRDRRRLRTERSCCPPASTTRPEPSAGTTSTATASTRPSSRSAHGRLHHGARASSPCGRPWARPATGFSCGLVPVIVAPRPRRRPASSSAGRLLSQNGLHCRREPHPAGVLPGHHRRVHLPAAPLRLRLPARASAAADPVVSSMRTSSVHPHFAGGRRPDRPRAAASPAARLSLYP